MKRFLALLVGLAFLVSAAPALAKRHRHWHPPTITVPAAQSAMSDTLMMQQLPTAFVVQGCDRLSPDLVRCRWAPVSYSFTAGVPTQIVGQPLTVYAARESKDCVFAWTPRFADTSCVF